MAAFAAVVCRCAGRASAHVTVDGARGDARRQRQDDHLPGAGRERRDTTVKLTVALPTATPIASVAGQADPGLDARETDGEAGQADQDRRRRHHRRRLRRSLDGRGRARPQAGRVRRRSRSSPAAAGHAVAHVQGDPDLQRRQRRAVDRAGAPASTAEPEHPAPVLTLAAASAHRAPTATATTPKTVVQKSSAIPAPTVLAIVAPGARGRRARPGVRRQRPAQGATVVRMPWPAAAGAVVLAAHRRGRAGARRDAGSSARRRRRPAAGRSWSPAPTSARRRRRPTRGRLLHRLQHDRPSPTGSTSVTSGAGATRCCTPARA